MRQHHVAFSVDDDIHLQSSHPKLQCALKSRDRIFRQQSARTAMTLQVNGLIYNISCRGLICQS